MELRVNVITPDHFKGILHREVALNTDGDTAIVGNNKSGKTTIFDAFTWGWTGKDSLGRKEFGIKTKQGGEVLHNCDYKVTLQCLVDGKPLEVRRVMNEVWGRSNGAETDTLQGHETHYYIDGLECRTKTEFDATLAGIVSEEEFRLLSDVTYFFKLKAEDQKRLLFSLERPVTDADVADCEPSVGELLELLDGHSIEAYYKEAKEKRSTLKKELDEIPTKIATKQEDMPDVEDWAAIAKERAEYVKERASLDGQLSDISNRENAESKRKVDLQRRIGELQVQRQQEISNLTIAANMERSNMLAEVEQMKNEKASKQRMIEQHTKTIADRRKQIAKYQKSIDALEQEMEKLRGDFYAVQAEAFTMPTEATICPTCLRPLEAGELASKEAELLARFNEDKSRRLSRIRTEGATKKQEQATNNQYIADYNAEIEELDEGIKTLSDGVAELERAIVEKTASVPTEVSVQSSPKVDELEAEIKALEEQKNTCIPAEDTSSLTTRKAEVDAMISKLDMSLANKEHYERINSGIESLQADQRAINKKLAEADHIIDLVELFIKTKDQILIDRINAHFEVVQFSFIAQRLNGKESITCECTVDGVDYKDVNNAGRINAGLDVINAFCKAKNIYIPIFIDNAEGVQDVLPTKSQKILLYVDQDGNIPQNAVHLTSQSVK